MFIVVLSCSGARIFVRYGSLNAIFATIAQARLKVDPVNNSHGLEAYYQYCIDRQI